jgi:DNA-binding transcriptional regulator LsrR (DeoR family)
MQFSDSTPEPPSDFDEELAATVSRLFWLKDQSKIEIADQLKISRFKVARILEDARRYGIARIEIVEPTQRTERLAEQVRDAYGLKDVRISTLPMGSPGGLAGLGATAAAYLDEHIGPGMTVGVGWGSTLAEVVGHLSPGVRADVLQLAGGFASSDGDFNGAHLVLQAASVLGGEPYLLHAPALVSSASARDVLREDETIARTAARYADLDIIVTGVGVRRAEAKSALYRGSVLSPVVHAELERRRVVGDACCHFIDDDGQVIDALAERVTGVSVDEIRATPLRMAVAGGVEKEGPVRAALRSGLPNVLVTDLVTARALIESTQRFGAEEKAEIA